MQVHIETAIDIAVPRLAVAEFAADPDRATSWYQNIKSVESDGPFSMKTTYRWRDVPAGGTHMTLANQGDPEGFSRLVAPFISKAMRRANNKDLERLKRILEARG